jgi:hypothetical protein
MSIWSDSKVGDRLKCFMSICCGVGWTEIIIKKNKKTQQIINMSSILFVFSQLFFKSYKYAMPGFSDIYIDGIVRTNLNQNAR